MEYRRTTQRDFIAAVRETPEVTYHHPGTFRAGQHEITVRTHRIAPFVARLAPPTLSFNAYDQLTRSVWVAHFRAEP